MRFSIDPWDPSYGSANEVEGLEESEAEVRLDVEVPADRWAPRRPVGSQPVSPRILFVDGVRRVDARIWIEAAGGPARPGICATYAAGAVRCDGSARMGAVVVGRSVLSAGPTEAVVTSAGSYLPGPAPSGTVEGLALALQQQMAEAEVAAAERACAEEDADLLIVDGPLRGRQHLPGAVGYIKTHHVAYLPPEQQAVVAQLSPGARTPLFVIGSGWSRQSWYLRLPSDGRSPWSGVVRCECPVDLPPSEAIDLADAVTAVLPRFASEAHKDPRAPQNLYPIAGLERELRHRLGDVSLVYRALRTAAG